LVRATRCRPPRWLAVLLLSLKRGFDALATLVVVTHSEAVAEAAARRVHMEDGWIVALPS